MAESLDAQMTALAAAMSPISGPNQRTRLGRISSIRSRPTSVWYGSAAATTLSMIPMIRSTRSRFSVLAVPLPCSMARSVSREMLARSATWAAVSRLSFRQFELPLSRAHGTRSCRRPPRRTAGAGRRRAGRAAALAIGRGPTTALALVVQVPLAADFQARGERVAV
jgi:hypothetical protein